MTATNTCYVVREHLNDGEYLTADGDRTPCGDMAAEYETYEEAVEVADREGMRVYARREGKWDWAVRGPVSDAGDEATPEQIVDEEFGLVCGNQVQHDNSGVGHNWRNIDAGDIPASIREEIEGEMIDGGKNECKDFVGSNGLHYRW